VASITDGALLGSRANHFFLAGFGRATFRLVRGCRSGLVGVGRHQVKLYTAALWMKREAPATAVAHVAVCAVRSGSSFAALGGSDKSGQQTLAERGVLYGGKTDRDHTDA
jgi:hypothetical protein